MRHLWAATCIVEPNPFFSPFFSNQPREWSMRSLKRDKQILTGDVVQTKTIFPILFLEMEWKHCFEDWGMILGRLRSYSPLVTLFLRKKTLFLDRYFRTVISVREHLLTPDLHNRERSRSKFIPNTTEDHKNQWVRRHYESWTFRIHPPSPSLKNPPPQPYRHHQSSSLTWEQICSVPQKSTSSTILPSRTTNPPPQE